MHRFAPVFAVTIGAVVALGCGRPATTEECQEIVGRIAELELKEAATVNPDEIQARVQETQNAFEQRSMKQCVGRRITEKALACVRSATTAEQIVDECFD